MVGFDTIFCPDFDVAYASLIQWLDAVYTKRGYQNGLQVMVCKNMDG